MLLNGLCNYLVLYLTALLLRRKVKKKRLFLGALLGGGYALLHLYISEKFFISALLSLLFSFFMVLTVFSFNSPSMFCRAFFSFYVTSFLTGGAVTACVSLTGAESASPLVSGILLVSLFLLSFFITFFGGKLLEKRCHTRWADVLFTFKEIHYHFPALVDSGNLLTDKETGLPVIVLSAAVFGDNIPECSRFLPVRTVSSSASFPCFLPDSLSVNGTRRQVLLAISPDNGTFGETLGLVPENLLY